MNVLTLGTTAIRQLDGLYSLNDLHAASGSDAKNKPANFIRLDGTAALVDEIKSSDLSITPVRAIKGNRADSLPQGTYVCRELVYAYAMWISPRFHLQVIRAFDAAATGQAQPAPALPAFDAAARKKLINRRAWALAQADYARYQALMEEAMPPLTDAASIHAWTPPPLVPATRIREALALMGMGGAQ